MPKYMLLIYGDESARPKPGSKALGEEAAKYETFTKSIVETGNFLDGDPFLPTVTAKTVQVRGGKTKTSSGPADTAKDQLQAYYKVQADDEAQAIEMASRIPGALHGTIEVRPVVMFE
jgi:hypothetical protein